MSVDTIGNFLTVIRNGIAVSKGNVRAPHSRVNHQIATILKQEGFIRDFAVEQGDTAAKTLRVDLKYVEGESVIHDLQRISTPGCRVYRGIVNLNPVIGGLGVSILTTSKGIMTDKEAKQKMVGGEVICTVW
jgi:small subunit ribosomal protein S8